MSRVQRPRGPMDDQRMRPKQLSPHGEALYELPLETTCDERTTSCAAISPTADDGGFPAGEGFTLVPENDFDGVEHHDEASAELSGRSPTSPAYDDPVLPDRGQCKDSLSVERTACKKQSLLVPCLAVFSSNYNFTVTSIALFLMNQDPVYKEASTNVVGNSTVKMLSYAGAIVGMCTMGYLGDLIGRRRAMVFTLFLVFVGALLSSVCPWGSGVSVLIIMGIFRFLLGVGSGGVYPLSAVSAAEGAGTDKSEDRSMRVSWTYSMNVPGIMAPYVVALILWSCTNDVNVCFRVLLAFGAIPALLIWLPAWRIKEDKTYVARDFAKHLVGVFLTRSYWRQLLGTGVCWLLYDVTAYGILLVQPEITQTIWGDKTSVTDIIWQNIVLNGMGIPGCYMGILVLRQMGVKWLQFWGFVGLAGSAFLMAATADALKGIAWAQLVLLCIVNFFINWGASITTFILPSLVFPPEVRSTYSGLSAALGKVGAVGGIYAMKAILSAGGLTPMMICAGVPSLVAAVLTWFYVDPVPSTLKSSCLQCFGSLAGSCPFVDCRRGKAACCGRAR
ncbi:major facilitator family protein [Cystoisospora suis]|uniref:Major facilitator family protein n=1 Tax=Cystoisospora suis TaxID=483139 RepID=A0A2C6KSR5_9APIC|nr:major facilitator family protein [Cystoisospora suis]